MAIDTVGVKYTADIADLQAAYDKLLKENLALQAANDKTEKGIQDGAKKSAGIINDLIAKEKQLVDARNKSNNTKDIEKFNKEIATTQKEMSKLISTTQDAGKKQGLFNNSLTKSLASFSVMSAGVDLLKGAITGAIQSQKEFQSSLSNLQAITGASTEDLKFYAEAAKAAGMEHGVMGRDVLEAYKLIGGAKPELLANKQALADVTEQAIILSKASGLELPEAAKRLTDAMNQFGAPAEDAGKFINILAEASKLGAAEVPQLTDAILLSGSAARASKISFSENAAILEAFADKGLKGAEAGTQLRNVMLKLTAVESLPKTAIDALEKAGVNMDTLSNTALPLKTRLEELAKIQGNSTAIVETFGLENFNAASILIDQRQRVDELSIALGKDGLTTALDQANINTDNLAGASERLAAQWDAVIQGDGDVSNFFKSVVEGAGRALTYVDNLGLAFKLMFKDLEELEQKDLSKLLSVGTLDSGKEIKEFLQPFEAIKDADFQKGAQNFKKQFVDTMVAEGEKAEDAGVLFDQYIRDRTTKWINAYKSRQEAATKDTTKIVDDTKKLTETEKAEAEKQKKEREKQQAEKLKMEQDYQKLLIENMKEGRGKELAELEFKYAAEREKLKGNHKALEQLEIAHQREQLAIIQKGRVEQMNAPGAVTPETVKKDQEKSLTEWEKGEADRRKLQDEAQQRGLEKKKQADDEELQMEKDKEQAKQEIIATVLDASFQIANSRRQANLDKDLAEIERQRELELANKELTEEGKAAIEAKFAAEETELKKKKANRDKLSAIFEATIAGALAVTKLLATPPLAIAAGIAAAAQIAIIAAQPLPQFREGVIDLQGPGTGTSDSIHARLSKGESVMTNAETKQHKAALMAMRRNNFEEYINTHYVLPVIKNMVQQRETAANMANSFQMQNMFDDSGIVNGLKKIKPATSEDIKQLGNTLSKSFSDAKYINSKMWKA